MSKANYDKVCQVCGDKSHGRNFGGLSCDSCKAFFRRAVNTKRTIVCSFDNNCKIDEKSRKFCKKCRLDKCLAIGMKKELIVKEEESDRIVGKKRKKKPDKCFDASPGCTTTCDSDYNSMSDAISVLSLDLSTDEMMELSGFGEEFDSVVETCCLSDEEMNEGITEFDKLLTESQNSSGTEEIKAKPSSVSSALVPVIKPIATYDKELNEIEVNRLAELVLASEKFSDVKDCSNIKNCIEFDNIEDLVKKMAELSDIYERTLMDTISFCKSMTAFKEVCEDDRVVLFKNSYWKIISLKYLKVYDFSGSFEFAINEDYFVRTNINILKKHDPELYELVAAFWENISIELIREPNLMNLMMAFVLFDFNTPNLEYKQLIKLNQQMYLYLLQRYLLQKFKLNKEDKLMEILSKLMKILMDLQLVYNKNMPIVKKNRQYLTPLALELYDL